jgi:hypothetical protein
MLEGCWEVAEVRTRRIVEQMCFLMFFLTDMVGFSWGDKGAIMVTVYSIWEIEGTGEHPVKMSN